MEIQDQERPHLAEAMLFEGGVIERRGDVESKNTVSDFKEIEQNNTCSVFSSLLYTIYNDHKINLIDVPGLDDFVNGLVSAWLLPMAPWW